MKFIINLFFVTQIAFLVSACTNTKLGMPDETAPMSRHDQRWNAN